MKTFKIFTDCYIKTCRSLKRRAILKIPSTISRRTYALSVGLKMKPLKEKRFPVLDQNQPKFCRKTCLKEQPLIFTVYLMNHIFQISVLLIRDNRMYKWTIDCVNTWKRSEAANQPFLCWVEWNSLSLWASLKTLQYSWGESCKWEVFCEKNLSMC